MCHTTSSFSRAWLQYLLEADHLGAQSMDLVVPSPPYTIYLAVLLDNLFDKHLLRICMAFTFIGKTFLVVVSLTLPEKKHILLLPDWKPKDSPLLVVL